MSVATQGSPLKYDIVDTQIYNKMNMDSIRYLPFVTENNGRLKSGVASTLSTFYSGSSIIASDAAPYIVPVYEPSPLGRIVKQGAPGTVWQPNSTNTYASTDYTIKKDYGANASSEVLMWTVATLGSSPMGLVNAGTASSPVYYSAGKLMKTRTKDEQQNEVIEYQDLSGHTVLKRVQTVSGSVTLDDTNYASTYYIYDELGNLFCVVPPEATKRLSTEYFQSGATDATKESFLKRWAFRYNYDDFRRMTQKQVPGADPVYMVYDNRDRLVLTQDGNQRSSMQWLFTKYDTLNRPIATGVYTHTSVVSQATMSGLISAGKFCETFDGNAYTCGYTNTVFPTTNLNYLTLMYYDSYDFSQGDKLFEYVPGDATGQPSSNFTRTIGKPTGTRVKVLGGEPQWIKSVLYYDDRGRVIQTISDQYRSGIERSTIVYDFVGKVIRTKTKRTDNRLSWTNLTAAQVKKDKVIQTSGGGWGSCSAASVESLPASTDGWIEATLSNNNHWATIGLSHQQNSGGAYNNDYSFFMSNDTGLWWNLVINEPSGFVYFAPGKVAFGDRVRIERVGTTVYYKLNDVIVYTSPTSSSGALYVNVGMADAGSYVYRPRTSFSVKSDSVMRRFTYDHIGRMLKTYHKLNNNTEVLLTQNEYNELGQLVDKKLHSTDGGTNFKQSIDYRYNIRGWLTKINESNVQDAGNLAADGSSVLPDLFGMELGYNASIGTGNTGLYNGNISAMKWSSNLSMGSVKDVAYNYSYDPMNRILSASYKKDSTGGWTNPSNAFNESGYSYDLNGNIKALTRKGLNGVSLDVLSYDYGSSSTSNKLLNVSDTGNMTTGFTEPTSTSGNDYDYDGNGNMIRDNNKKINAIYYNHLNLPAYLTKETGENLIYTYDATGRKHSQDIYSSSWVLLKSTDYSGEYFYENDTLKFINHEEGRIVMTGVTPEYQYHLKDHLGNVRVTFTSQQTTTNYTTNFEASSNSDFQNYSNTTFDLVDHTDAAGTTYQKVQYLNGGVNGRVGLSKSFAVMPGDEVTISAYCKYMNLGTTTNTTALLGSLAAAFGVSSSSTGEGASIYNGLSSFASLVGGGEHTNDDDGVPKVFATILFFDENHRYVDAAWKQVTSTGAQTSGSVKQPPHDLITKTAKAPVKGFAYVFLSNEHPTYVDVYFDDATVSYTPSPVVQVDDYYPFGLTFNSYRRENNLHNQYQYNGKEMQDELNLGWLDYGARMYMPEIGRWGVKDPISEQYKSLSPYNFATNNPIRYVDINGYGPGDRVKKARALIGHEYYPKIDGKYIVEENSKLRTQNTQEALKYMDCAEFVCRVLAADGITKGVVHMGSAILKPFLDDKSKFTNSFTPQVGDIALWKGHTGIVTGVEGKKINLTAARGRGKLSAENSSALLPEQYAPGEFYGYYRPISENHHEEIALTEPKQNDSQGEQSSQAQEQTQQEQQFRTILLPTVTISAKKEDQKPPSLINYTRSADKIYTKEFLDAYNTIKTR